MLNILCIDFDYVCCLLQYPMDKNKGSKIPTQIRVNMWLGLVAVEKKFNAYAEGTFNVYAELVNLMCLLYCT